MKQKSVQKYQAEQIPFNSTYKITNFQVYDTDNNNKNVIFTSSVFNKTLF